MSDSLWPHGLPPPGSSVHEIFQARILERVAFSFSRGSSPTQGSNPGLLHCRQILNQLSYKGSPQFYMESSKYFIGKGIFRLDGNQWFSQRFSVNDLVKMMFEKNWCHHCRWKKPATRFLTLIDSSGICKRTLLFIIIIMLQPTSVSTFTIRL